MTKLCSAWFGVGCLSLMVLQGCGSVCGDDGFAWQQKDNPACLAESQASATESNSNTNTESDSDSLPTGGPTESNSNTNTESDSNTNGDGTHCADGDGDGHGDPGNCMDAPFPGSVPGPGDDCDDTDPNTFPGAAEKDDPDACMTDADGDGYGEKEPKPGVEPGTDCDDQSSTTFPGAAEKDDPTACMQDADGDGHGDDTPSNPGVTPGTDCDDDNVFTFPGAAPNDDPEACMTDEDDDDYGDDNPGPGVKPGTDCADFDAAQHENCTGCEPNGAECNGNDLEQCNADGTDFMIIPCEFGCDDNGDKCWEPLTVEAGPSICLDNAQSAQLDAIAMGGDGNYTWAWTPPDGLSDPAIPNPSAMPTGVTDYTITVSDGEGNVAADSVSVFLKNQALPFDPDVCEIYNFPHENVINDPNPDWQWNDQTKTLCQVQNAKASALFCGWTLDNATITGSFGVNTAQDDDWVGFMWGIQDTDHFYIFTWKQLAQTPYASCDGVPLNVPTGMQVKRIGVGDPAMPLSCHDLHAPADTQNSVLLQSTTDFYNLGWLDNIQYIYELTHHTNGDMEIIIRNQATMVIVAQTMFNDPTYPSGQFGMYTKSQISACFTNFKVSCL